MNICIPIRTPLQHLLVVSLCLWLTGCTQSSLFRVIPVDHAAAARSDEFYELLAAEFAAKAGDNEIALVHYKKAAEISRAPEVLKVAIAVAVQLGNYDIATSLAEIWHRDDPENLELNQVLAFLNLRRQQYHEVLPHLEFIVNHDRNLIPNIRKFPLFEKVASDVKSETMDALRAEYPDNAHVQFVYALTALQGRHYDAALQAAERAAELAPDLVKAQALKADILEGFGRTDESLALLRRQVELHPHHRQLVLKAAGAHLRHDRNSVAQELYRHAHSLDPANPDIIYTLGVLSLHSGDLNGARRLFFELGTYDGRRDQATYYLGRVSAAEGDVDIALGYYTAVSGKLFYEAQIGIARVYQTQGDTGRAETVLEDARARTENARGQIALFIVHAEILEKAGRPHDAMALYTRGLDKHKNSLDLLYSRAMLAERIERLDIFERDLKHVIQLDPNNLDALNALGYVLADRNIRLHEARKYIRRAYSLRPNDPAILDSMGWVEFRLNNLEVAEAFVRKAASVLHDAEVLGHLAEILWSQQRREEARDLIESSLREFPGDEYLVHLKKLKVE